MDKLKGSATAKLISKNISNILNAPFYYKKNKGRPSGQPFRVFSLIQRLER